MKKNNKTDCADEQQKRRKKNAIKIAVVIVFSIIAITGLFLMIIAENETISKVGFALLLTGSIPAVIIGIVHSRGF